MKSLSWTRRAKVDLNKIAKFYSKLYGNVKAIEIIEAIKAHASILESPDFNFKESGEIDAQFEHLEYEYRKLIHHHCKITYREGKEFIYIVRVFDTRQASGRNL